MSERANPYHLAITISNSPCYQTTGMIWTRSLWGVAKLCDTIHPRAALWTSPHGQRPCSVSVLPFNECALQILMIIQWTICRTALALDPPKVLPKKLQLIMLLNPYSNEAFDSSWRMVSSWLQCQLFTQFISIMQHLILPLLPNRYVFKFY